MTPKGPTWHGYAWAALAALAFSFEGVLARAAFALGGASFAVMAARFLLAAALVFLARRAAPRAPGRGRRRDALILGATGFAGYAGTTALLFLAFGRIPTSMAILLLYAYPALVAAGGHFLGRERLTAVHAGALALTFAGAAVVSGAGGGLEPGGAMAAVLAAVAMSLTMLVQQPVLARVAALEAAYHTLVGGAAGALVLAFATGQALPPPAASWPYIAGLAVLPSIVAVLSINRGVQLVGASRTAIVATLEPPMAALWGSIWLGESFGPTQAIGGLLVLAGVALIQTLPPRTLGTISRDP